MCGSEPCAHERDYTTGQAMKSYVAASALAGDAAIQRDAARAALGRVRALHVSEDNDRDAEWCVHDRMTWPCPTIRAALEGKAS